MALLIKNGKIITAEQSYQADLLIEAEKIVQIGKDIKAPEAEIIDAAGKYILPGAIDAHVHMQMPFGGTVSADDYAAGTKAAACGGVTSIIDFVTQAAGETLVDSLKRKEAACIPQAHIDYGFHVCITKMAENTVAEMKELVAYGVPTFKVFTAYKSSGLMIEDGDLVEVMQAAKEIGARISVHAENGSIIDNRVAKFLAAGKTSAWYHYLSRPEFVEEEATLRVINLAKSLDVPVYIVHLASQEGVKAVNRARNEGYEIYAETCPQYLHFTKDVYKQENAKDFVCSPPIKGQASQDELWRGIERGDISVLATDHCPFTAEEKEWGKDDFSKIPNGCMGVENIYPYMLDKANQGQLTFNKVVELCASNPAQLFGCSDQKGTIAPGYDADIVIYDPEQKFTVTADKMHSNIDYTIWEGLELSGYPVTTISRGEIVYNNGEFLAEPGRGKFIARSLEA
jgi:dihydropyrimidinase